MIKISKFKIKNCVNFGPLQGEFLGNESVKGIVIP
jgi:hypothetical protein